MTSKSRTLSDLFLHTLKDVHYAEKHIGKILPKLAKAAQSAELKQAFEAHREETQTHADRLEQIFELLGKKEHNAPCEAIQGLIEDAKRIIDDYEDSAAIDAGLIAAGQSIEQYEIARYGALKAWAAQLGYNQAATLLEETLAEEKKAAERLGALAGALGQDGGPPVVSGRPSQPSGETRALMTLKVAALYGLR